MSELVGPERWPLVQCAIAATLLILAAGWFRSPPRPLREWLARRLEPPAIGVECEDDEDARLRAEERLNDLVWRLELLIHDDERMSGTRQLGNRLAYRTARQQLGRAPRRPRVRRIELSPAETCDVGFAAVERSA